MANRGVIHINRPSTYYKITGDFVASDSTTGSAVGAIDRSYIETRSIQWGTSSKILVTFQTFNMPLSSGVGWSLKIDTPWGTHTVSGVTFQPAISDRIEWDNVVNTVSGSCALTLTSDELRWYVDSGAGFVLVYTLHAPGETGTSNLLLNCMKTTYTVTYNPAFAYCGVAGNQFSGVAPGANYLADFIASSKVGYTYNESGAGFVNEAVLLKAEQNTSLNCGGCTKTYTSVVCSLSDDIEASSDFHREISYVAGTNIVCPCFYGPPGAYAEYIPYAATMKHWERVRELTITPKTSQIFPYETILTGNCCALGTSEHVVTDSAETDTFTRCEDFASVLYGEQHFTYYWMIHNDICFFPIGQPSPPPCPIEPTPTTCWYESSWSYKWTTPPRCSAATITSYNWSRDGRHGRLYKADSVNIGTMRTHRSFNWVDLIPGVDMEWASIHWNDHDKKADLWVFYGDVTTHDAILARTWDQGNSLHTIMTIDATVKIGDWTFDRDGRLIFYYVLTGANTIKYKKYDRTLTLISSGNTNITDADTSLSVDGFEDVNGSWRMGLFYIDVGGTAKFVESDRGGINFA